jgi:hypothetical protein
MRGSVANIPEIMAEHAFWAGSVCTAGFGGFLWCLCNSWCIFKTNTKMTMTVEVRTTVACLVTSSGISGISSDSRHCRPCVTNLETFVTLFVPFTILGRAAVPRWSLGRWLLGRWLIMHCLRRKAYFPEAVAIFYHLAA